MNSPCERTPPDATANIIIINGVPTTELTETMTVIATMDIVRDVNMRPDRIFKLGAKPKYNKEAWLGTRAGSLQNLKCTNCQKGHGPFVDCVVVSGHLKEACTNCYYGGSGSRCSLRHDHEKAVAQLEANDVAAPEISGMRPANFYGGSLKETRGFDGMIAAPAATAPNLAPQPPVDPALPRGGGTGGARRIAPLWVAPVGTRGCIAARAVGPYGNTGAERIAHARSLTLEELVVEEKRIKKMLIAVRVVIEERRREENQEHIHSGLGGD